MIEYVQGVDSEVVSLEDIISPEDVEDISAGENGQLRQEFYDELSASFGERIRQCGPRVPVVTGEQSSPFFSVLSCCLLRVSEYIY